MQGALGRLASGSTVKCVIAPPARVFPHRTFKILSYLENVLKMFHCIKALSSLLSLRQTALCSEQAFLSMGISVGTEPQPLGYRGEK